jgi:ribosome-associated protein
VADELEVAPGCTIPLAELEWKFTPSGGPGGQHANRSNTRVEVVFDVEGSPSLTDTQRTRMMAKLGPVVRVVADDERSQGRNRALALERLRERLAASLVVPKRRRATKPSRGSKERRLETKRHQSDRKAARRRPTRDD